MTATESGHTYSRGPSILAAAAEAWGIEVTDSQLAEWQYLISTAYELDNILDGDENWASRQVAYDSLADAKFRRVNDTELVSFAGGWSVEKTDRLYSVAAAVKDLSIAKRDATSPRTLGRLAMVEGKETARLLQVGDNDMDDHNITSFNQWLIKLMRLGVIVDTAVDLPEDYDNGLTRVKPTQLNRGIIASFGIPDLTRIAVTTPARLHAMLIPAALATVGDKDKDTVLRSSPRGIIN